MANGRSTLKRTLTIVSIIAAVLVIGTTLLAAMDTRYVRRAEVERWLACGFFEFPPGCRADLIQEISR